MRRQSRGIRSGSGPDLAFFSGWMEGIPAGSCASAVCVSRRSGSALRVPDRFRSGFLHRGSGFRMEGEVRGKEEAAGMVRDALRGPCFLPAGQASGEPVPMPGSGAPPEGAAQVLLDIWRPLYYNIGNLGTKREGRGEADSLIFYPE